MSPITKEFTKEQLQQIIETDHVQCGEALALARIALASLEAEPVAFRSKLKPPSAIGSESWDYTDHRQPDAFELESCVIERLYTAPAAPVSVPAAMEMDDDFDSAFEHGKAVGWNAYRAAMLQGANGKPELTVWYGAMPESNGKANWTAILHRKGEGRCMNGFTIDRSEYPGRVLYAADRVRYLIGEKSERPSILDYDADAHSGYMKTGNSPVIPDGWVACSEKMPEENSEQEVLACFKGGDISTLYYFEGRWDDAYGIVPIRQDVTHWMPLPAASQQEVTQALAKGMERYGDAMQKLADSGD